MRKIITLVAILVTPLLAAQSSQEPDEISIQAFTKLRMEYAGRPDYNPDSGWDDRKKVFELSKAGEKEQALAMCESRIKDCPIDSEVYIVRALILRGRGDFQGYVKNKLIYQGLVASIVSSGDGFSPATAIKVVCVSEEYALLNELGAELKQQELVSSEQRVYDKMTCEISGKEVSFFFDVTLIFEARAKLMGLVDSDESVEKTQGKQFPKRHISFKNKRRS
ncbi:MAG: DUF4919 domain-containing protein [Phycisphaerae bacterium]|jgi:hypothetical protein